MQTCKIKLEYNNDALNIFVDTSNDQNNSDNKEIHILLNMVILIEVSHTIN